MKRLSPVIVVDAVEPCLPFWRDRLGFEVTVTVPHGESGDTLGFAIVEKDGVAVMYQSRASVEDDLPSMAEEFAGRPALLFIEVEELDPVADALEDADVVVPRRTTFYGMDEIFVRADCGSVVGFAASTGEQSDAG